MASLRHYQPAFGRSRHCGRRCPRFCPRHGRVRRDGCRRGHDSAKDDDDFTLDLSPHPAWTGCGSMASPFGLDWHRFRYRFMRATHLHAQKPAMNLRFHRVRLSLADFNLEIDATLDRPVTGVFGPSGAGKTSLLDLIAGLRRPDAGKLQIDGKVLFDA